MQAEAVTGLFCLFIFVWDWESMVSENKRQRQATRIMSHQYLRQDILPQLRAVQPPGVLLMGR